MERELRLRDHIRGLLLDYCRTHITEDYVTYTQDAVQMLLSDRIALVSLEDPNSVVLPVDPMDTLLCDLDTPIIPEEKCTTDTDALGHIRKSMNLGVMSLGTSKCWHEPDPYERAAESFRPMSPILSSRALKQTPKFGEPGTTTSPDSLRSTLDAYTLVLTKVPDIPAPSLPTLEEILDIQYKIEPNLHRATVSLIRSVHTGTKSVPDHTNSSVETFLRSESPPLPLIETVEVPIFPRSSRPGFMDVEVEEEDLNMEHMKVVDGWTVYASVSSPPTPSLGLGGTSSEVDELFPRSPPAGPGDGVSILELESLKMGEVQIPRKGWIGHTDNSPSRHPQSLALFLPQHHISSVDLVIPKEVLRPLEYADDTTITSSMLGQPPSKVDAGNNELESHVDEDELATDLRAIWSKAGCDEFEIILQDGIDESKALLFEIPELPPPTAHKPWEQLPENLPSLTSSLGMVKGIRPLNLELSWVPFKYGSKVPTNEEVSRVSESILDDLAILTDQDPCQRDEARRLLSDLVSPTPLEPISDLSFAECTHPEDFVVAEILYNDSVRPHQFVLTRDERQRAPATGANLPDSLVSDLSQHLAGPAGDGMTPDLGGGEHFFEELEFNSQIPRRDLAELEYLPPEVREDEYEEESLPGPAKRRRLGDFSPAVDSRLVSPLASPDSGGMDHAIPSSMAEGTPLEQTGILDGNRFPQFPLASQNTRVFLDSAPQPRDHAPPNLPATRHSVPPPTGRAVEFGPASVTGRRQEFADFLALRGVHLSAPPAATAAETATDNPRPTEGLRSPQLPPTEIPPDLIDTNTIQLPAADSFPASRHQYLASLDLLQKHSLCRCLSSDPAAIDLVERGFLGGVDLILDQDTAILFLPLSMVPSECEGLIVGICDISWRYSHILVIFEVFLSSQAFGDSEENRIAPFAFTEPIMRSTKKLKRSLAIAEGVGTKAEDCLVSWAFAKNIEEAATLARVYGDAAESRDTMGSTLWQERWWLGQRETEDSPLSEFEDETDLAMMAGMNAFAACLILSQMSSGKFLSLTPQGRTDRFGQLLGIKRMAELNRALEQTIAAISSPLPTSDLKDSSSAQL